MGLVIVIIIIIVLLPILWNLLTALLRILLIGGAVILGIYIIYRIIRNIYDRAEEKRSRIRQKEKERRLEEQKRQEEIRAREEFFRECQELGMNPDVARRCDKCQSITENDWWCDDCLRKELIIINKGRAPRPDAKFTYINDHQFKIYPLPECNPRNDQISLPFVDDIKMTLWVDEGDGFIMLCDEHLPTFIVKKKNEVNRYSAKQFFNKKVRLILGTSIGDVDYINITDESTGYHCGTRIIPKERDRYSASCLFFDDLIESLVEESEGENLIFAVPTLSLLYVARESETRAVDYLKLIAEQEYEEKEDNWSVTNKLLRYNTEKKKFEMFKQGVNSTKISYEDAIKAVLQR
jgi:hypothetical protein